MSEQIGSIIWTIAAKTDQLEKDLKSALDKVNLFKDKTESADKSASTFEQTMGLMAQSLRSVESEASSGSEGIESLTQKILQSGKATEEQAEIIARGMIEQRNLSDSATQFIEEYSRSAEEASKSSEQFADALKDVENQAKESAKGISGLKGAISALIGGFAALKVVRTIVDQFKQSIERAHELNRVMTQTEVTIASTGMVAGMSAERIKQMADEIQDTTAISNTAAQAGMNMLLQYTRIGQEVFPEATQAMIDMATAINGGVIPSASQLESTAKQLGRALNDPINGVTMLTRSGITFTEQQRDQIRTLTESGRLLEAQGIILDRLRVFQGSAEAQAGTFEGQISRLNNQLDDIRRTVGNSVLPALTHFIEGIQVGEGATNGLIFVIRGLVSAFTGVIMAARMAGIAISTALSAGFAAVTGDFDLARNTIKVGFDDMVAEAVRTQETISNIWSDETKKQTGFSLQEFQNQDLASGKKSQKIIDDLEKETEAYRRSVEKRRIQFERAMADLVWAHQDKVKQLREDIKTEEHDFAKSMAEREKKFTESMKEMEEAHLKKTETIEKQLAREEQKQEDKVAEAILKGQKQLDEEEKQFAKREAILESQIENELSKGEYASESVLETLRRRLDNERAIHANKVDEIKGQIDDETKKAIDSHKHRIEDLQERLDEATKSNAKEKDKRETSYEEETTKLQQEHNKRVSDFRESLDEELDILNRHQDSVDMVKDKARLDDIARLKRQFEEQSREEEANHQRRMEDIRTRGAQAGETLGNTINAGLASIAPNIKNTAANIGSDINREISRNTHKDMQSSGRSVMRDFFEGMKWSIRNQAPTLKDQLVNALSVSIPPVGLGRLLTGSNFFADGVQNFQGGYAVVGERGPEVVKLPRGSDVIPNEVAFGGQGGSANVYIDQVNEKSDVDMIIRELGFKSSIMN